MIQDPITTSSHDNAVILQQLEKILGNQARHEGRIDAMENKINAMYLVHERIKKETVKTSRYGGAKLPLYTGVVCGGDDDDEEEDDEEEERGGNPSESDGRSPTWFLHTFNTHNASSLKPHETSSNYWLCSQCSIQ